MTDLLRFIQDTHWIVLGRAASAVELRDAARGFGPDSARALLMRLLSSPEFLRIRDGWASGRDAYRDAAAVEAGLGSVGGPAAFVSRVYECLLGRPADAAVSRTTSTRSGRETH